MDHPSPDGAPQPPDEPQYQQPQYGQPQYGHPQYGQPQYGQPQYQQPQYGQPQYGQPQYGQPQYGQPPRDPYYDQFGPRQPGSIPLRPLGVGEILDGSFKVITGNPRTTLGLSAAFAVVQVSMLAAVQIFVLRRFTNGLSHHSFATNGSSGVDTSGLVSTYLSILAAAFVAAILTSVLTGMLTWILAEDTLGNKASISATWARVRPQVFRLMMLSVVVNICAFTGLVLIAPGVWIWGIWAVAAPAMVIERTGLGLALKRSWRLVRGSFWRVWGIRALGVLLVSVASGMVSVPFIVIAGLVTHFSAFNFGGGTSSSVPVLYTLITSVGSIIAATLTAPVKAGIDALLYLDLRMRKEGLDIALRQAAASGSQSPQ